MSEITIRVEGSIEIKDVLRKLSNIKSELREKESGMRQFEYERNLNVEKVGGFRSDEGRTIMTKTYPTFKKITHDITILDGKIEMLEELVKDFMAGISENILDYIY